MPPRTSPTVDEPGDRADRPRPLQSERPVGRSAERAVREPRLLTPSVRLRRAVTLVLLSCVVPGSAQVLAGNRRLGRLLLRGWLAVVGLVLFAGLLLLLDRSFVLSLLTSPFGLVLVAPGCFVA